MLTGIATAAGQVAGKRVKVNGMQMYYEVSGEGDPLVVLHGAYMNRWGELDRPGRVWRAVSALLAVIMPTATTPGLRHLRSGVRTDPVIRGPGTVAGP